MKLLTAGIVVLIGYSILVLQFYVASKKGYTGTADVIAKGSSLAILNQRHLLSLLAMAASILYVGFVNSDWLQLHTTFSTMDLTLILLTGATAFVVSTSAAHKALCQEAPVDLVVDSTETYLLLRGLFLMCYEIFFRGVLLNFCITITTVPIAVVTNVVLYAIAHTFSTRQELIGSVPFGIVLCLLTLYTRSVWPAVIIHVMLGLPYDVLILYAPKRITKTFSL
jgi:membrane protease YdiL (CAAX protease family)